jgi:UDP-glucose 4-epimerase
LLKKYLVLGGSGFIGRHLVKKLSTMGSVRVFDRQDCVFPDLAGEIENISGDFSTVCMEDILSDVDTVYHLISTTTPSDNTSFSVNDMTYNVIPTIKLLEAMAVGRHKKIIFLSSGGTVYGDIKIPATEETPLNPVCSYGIQKATIEMYIKLYNRYHGISAITARLSNPYGTGQQEKRRQGVIPIFTNYIKNGTPIEIWGDGGTVRDFIHIDDAIEALALLDKYSGRYSTFNIGSGMGHSILEIIDMISKQLKKEPIINYLPTRKCDVPYNVLDVGLIKQELNWSAKITLDQGIKMLL